MRQPYQVIVPNGATQVLLHACCAPCSSAIVECLLQHHIQPVIFYCNPNIFPAQEFTVRYEECIRYATTMGLQIVEDNYCHDEWLAYIRGLEQEPERGHRCLQCFKFRLLRTAQYAQAHGFSVITTTLASSRWKSLEQINEAGIWACQQVEGVIWWDQNWRRGGLQERRRTIINEYGFYNQLYCGCEFSLTSSQQR